MAKRAEKPPHAAGGWADALVEARDEMRKQLDVLAVRREELVSTAKEEGGAPFDPDLSQACAALGRAITGATAELRQQERHRKRMVEEMPPDERRRVGMQFIRELDLDGREEVRELLDELDGEERGIGG